jgi:hypothetical protein
MLGVLGVLAGLLQAAASVPYVRDVLRGSTRPHRGTWAIWCILSAIVLASQRAAGASWSLALVVAQFLGTLMIVLLAIPRGVGGATRLDAALLAVAAAGLVGWYLAGDATIATACVVFADSVAVVLMLPKTFRDPYSETLSTYLLGLGSVVLAAASVGALDLRLLLYPLYLAVAESVVAGLIAVRRRQLGNPHHEMGFAGSGSG